MGFRLYDIHCDISVDVDTDLREIEEHGRAEFPVAIYSHHFDHKKHDMIILHWHEELQFILQQNGCSVCTVSETPYTLHPGDVLFINSQRLHMETPVSDTSDNICIDIHPRFLYGASDLIDRNYVQPFLAADGITALLVDGSEAWHKDFCQLVKELVDVYKARGELFELVIQKVVLEIWILLLHNNNRKIQPNLYTTQAEQDRISTIIAYIHRHYTERITLSDISASAGISTSECCRFVKRILNISPMTYLNNFRIVKSTDLLQSTDLSITEVANAVGFETSSYFSARFKQRMNCKPLEYRRRFRGRPCQDFSSNM